MKKEKKKEIFKTERKLLYENLELFQSKGKKKPKNY